MNDDSDDDSDDEGVDAVVGRLGEQPGESLTPERLEAIQTAMHGDLGRFVDSTAYFVLALTVTRSGTVWRPFGTNWRARGPRATQRRMSRRF